MASRYPPALRKLAGLIDWSTTAVGALDAWSPALRAVVETMCACPLPMTLMWGPDAILIYNDGYAGIAGSKHPAALGQPARDVWPEAWDFNREVVEKVTAGASLTYTSLRFALTRNGETSDAWFDLAYSPVRDDRGTIGGVLAVVVEITERMRLEDRMRVEREHTAEMFRQAPSFMAQLEGPRHVFTFTNDAYQQLIGHRPVVGKPVRDALPDIAGQGFY